MFVSESYAIAELLKNIGNKEDDLGLESRPAEDAIGGVLSVLARSAVVEQCLATGLDEVCKLGVIRTQSEGQLLLHEMRSVVMDLWFKHEHNDFRHTNQAASKKTILTRAQSMLVSSPRACNWVRGSSSMKDRAAASWHNTNSTAQVIAIFTILTTGQRSVDYGLRSGDAKS